MTLDVTMVMIAMILTRNKTEKSYLFTFNEVRYFSIVINTTDIEASACSGATQTRDDSDLGLVASGINSAHLHTSTRDTHKPARGVHSVLLREIVKTLIPEQGQSRHNNTRKNQENHDVKQEWT